MQFNGFISDYLELVFLLKSFRLLSRKKMDNFRVTNMTATFQLWISTSSIICISFPHIFSVLNLISIAVRVNWYQLLAKHGICSEYQPQRFHAIIQRCKCRDASITASIFKSGCVVLTGGRSPDACRKAALRICRRINHAVYRDLTSTRLKRFACYRFKIENVVCAFKCTHQLAIEKLYEDYCKGPPQQFDFAGMQAKMIYRPTSFTALRLSYKSGTQKIALMLFTNGNVTLSGLKNEQDSQLFAQQLYSLILSNYIRSPSKHLS